MTEPILRRLIFAGLLVLGLALSSLTQSQLPLHLLASEVSARTAPLFGLGYRLGQNLRGNLAALTDRRNIRNDNKNLRAGLANLKTENSRLQAEVRKLTAALRIKESQATRVIAVAPVVGEDVSGLYRRLYLGMGQRSGLRTGMPVTSPNGLVGVIVEVSEESAMVRTILDPESRVGVNFENKQGRGIATGLPPGQLRLEFSPQAALQPGDRVLSGAIQGLFPEGIVVGTITSVANMQPGSLRQVAIVRPAVEFSLLEEVVVLPPL